MMTQARSAKDLEYLYQVIEDQKKIVQPDEILINRYIRVDIYGQVSILEDPNDLKSETWNFVHIPEVGEKCVLCEKAWNLVNLKTYVKWDGQGYHKDCIRLQLAHKERIAFLKAFEDAGFGPISVKELENGYWSASRYYSTPWYEVTTLKGRFKIGNRKRVTHIERITREWPDRKNDKRFDELFADENVTVDGDSVHAWTYEKVTEYLTKINNATEY